MLFDGQHETGSVGGLEDDASVDGDDGGDAHELDVEAGSTRRRHCFTDEDGGAASRGSARSPICPRRALARSPSMLPPQESAGRIGVRSPAPTA